MGQVPCYRLSLYLVNALLITIQISLLHWGYLVFTDPLMNLFPINFTDFPLIATCTSMGVQFLACFFGIYGVACSNRNAIRVYWLLIIPIVIFDSIQVITWALNFQRVHSGYALYLETLAETEILKTIGNTTFSCDMWMEVHNGFQCCPPKAVEINCPSNDFTLCDDATSNCALPLLRWLHGSTDLLGTVFYFLLYPMKLIALIMLK
jgi:hypothetical protein